MKHSSKRTKQLTEPALGGRFGHKEAVMMSITATDAYQHLSFEELRMQEDTSAALRRSNLSLLD